MTTETRQALQAQLIRHERMVLHVYQDSKGFWTLGIGRLVDARKGGGISTAEAMLLLNNDIDDRLIQVFQRLPWAADLDEVRQIALVNLAFQLGMDGLLQFKRTLGALREHRYNDAAHYLLDSKLAKVDSPGRALEESEMFRTGELKV